MPVKITQLVPFGATAIDRQLFESVLGIFQRNSLVLKAQPAREDRRE